MIVSICIILAIAILRQYSKTIAAIAATMPINLPLGLWIVASSSENSQVALSEFSEALVLNLLPTMIFMIVVWQMTRIGYGLVPSILAGYAAWAVGLGAIYLLRSVLGH